MYVCVCVSSTGHPEEVHRRVARRRRETRSDGRPEVGSELRAAGLDLHEALHGTGAVLALRCFYSRTVLLLHWYCAGAAVALHCIHWHEARRPDNGDIY